VCFWLRPGIILARHIFKHLLHLQHLCRLLSPFRKCSKLLKSIVQGENTNAGPFIDAVRATYPPRKSIRLDAATAANPFYRMPHSSFIDASETELTLVDGGLDGQVIPLQPLFVKSRNLDVVIAIDAVRDQRLYYPSFH
jgi:hypothetical protein